MLTEQELKKKTPFYNVLQRQKGIDPMVSDVTQTITKVEPKTSGLPTPNVPVNPTGIAQNRVGLNMPSLASKYMPYQTPAQPNILQNIPNRKTEQDFRQFLTSKGLNQDQINIEVQKAMEKDAIIPAPKKKVSELIDFYTQKGIGEDVIIRDIQRGLQEGKLDNDIEGVEFQMGDKQKEQQMVAENKSFPESFNKGVGNIIGGAVSQAPQIASNIGGFFLGKPVDYALKKMGLEVPSLEEHFKQAGIQDKQQLQQILGVDPDKFLTKTGEFGAEIASLFTGAGEAKIMSKLPKYKEIAQGLEKLQKYAPKAYNYLKAGIVGSKEMGKYGIVSKGDITKEDLLLGAGFGVGGQFIGNNYKVLSDYIKTPFKGITPATEYTTKLFTGLNRETQQFIKNNPEIWKKVKSGEINPQELTNQVGQGINKRLAELSETGKGYEVIKQNPTTFKKGDFKKIFDDTLKKEGVSTELTELPTGDRTAIKNAYKYLDEYKTDDIATKGAIELKTKLRSLVSYKEPITPTGERIVKGMIKEVDNNLKSKLPELKKLDEIYGPEREFLNKVRKDIFNPDGTLKDNAISTIRNLTGKGKEFKIERLENITPGITEKVKGIKAFEDLQASIEGKTGSYARGIIVGGGGIAGGPIGAITGFITTNPSIAAKVLEMYGVGKFYIKSIIGKIKGKISLTTTEQTTLINAIKKTDSNKLGKEILALPPGKTKTPEVFGNPIITPQTRESGIVFESKKGLGKTKFGNLQSNNITNANINDNNILPLGTSKGNIQTGKINSKGLIPNSQKAIQESQKSNALANEVLQNQGNIPKLNQLGEKLGMKAEKVPLRPKSSVKTTPKTKKGIKPKAETKTKIEPKAETQAGIDKNKALLEKMLKKKEELIKSGKWKESGMK